ncbi:MAG: hypothetical protein KAI47_09110 [Deltaproteobacteria bacterium]|nr:hypothetical protein [Deltaproteobacteria bacterium]
MNYHLRSCFGLSERPGVRLRFQVGRLMVAAIVALLFSLGAPVWAAGPRKARRKTVQKTTQKVAAKSHSASSKKKGPGNDENLKRACQNAFIGNDHVRALRLCLRYFDTHPDDQRTLGIAGMAACKLHRRAAIARIWARVKPPGRVFLRQVCSKNGITLRRGKVLMRRHRPARPRRPTRRIARGSDQAKQVLQAAATPLVLTPRMLKELRSCFPPPLMASARRYSGVWVALVDIKVTRKGRVSQVRVRNSWRHASICLACLRVATKRWRFAPRAAPTVMHHLLRVRPFP